MGVAMSSVRELNKMLERVDRRLGTRDDEEDIGPLGLGKKGSLAAEGISASGESADPR